MCQAEVASCDIPSVSQSELPAACMAEAEGGAQGSGGWRLQKVWWVYTSSDSNGYSLKPCRQGVILESYLTKVTDNCADNEFRKEKKGIQSRATKTVRKLLQKAEFENVEGPCR